MTGRQTTIELVEIMHRAFAHTVQPSPTIPDYRHRLLRLTLLLEELQEFAIASGFKIEATIIETGGAPDLIDAADALGDLDVVLCGSFLTWGMPQQPIAEEIFRSNMSKLDHNGNPLYREDGKFLKGPNYSPPDIAAVLRKFGGAA